MASYVAYADYVIFFRNAAEYNFAVAAAGGNGFQKNPAAAAAQFGITFPPPGGDMDTMSKGIYVPAGGAYYSLVEPGSIVNHPLPSGVRLSPSVDAVVVPGQAGNPASIWPAGPDMVLTWFGLIVKMGGSTGVSPSPTTPIPQRRFTTGFEIYGSDDGLGGSTPKLNRDASRTLEGTGWGLRNDAGVTIVKNVNQFQAGFTTRKSWERFYARARVLPAAPVAFWKSRGSASVNAGGQLKINSNGTITVSNIDSALTETVLGTSAASLVLNQWYRIDIIVQYNDGTNNGHIRVYINGAIIFDFAVAAGIGGLGQTQNHGSTAIGIVSAAANTLELDLDDWINADVPTFSGAESLDSIDWLNGIHIRKAWGLSSGALASGWVGSYEVGNLLIDPLTSTGNAVLTSSTALARIDIVTDVNEDQDSVGLKGGVISGIVTISSLRAAVDGQLGYTLAGGAPVLITIVQDVAFQFNSAMYRPTGMITPTSIIPFDIIHDKGNSAGASTVRGLQAILEYLGTFSPEDDTTATDLPRAILHNSSYYNTPWAWGESVPDAPVAAVGGLYTGNGTSQHVNLPLPCHFLWIRPLSGTGAVGVKWFGAALGPHSNSNDTVFPEFTVRVWTDSTGQTKFTVVGSDPSCNQNTIIYQFIAFCDPAMRWNLCGAFRHATAVSPFSNPLIDPTFTPIGGFLLREFLTTSPGGTTGIMYKGPGHAGNTGNTIAGTALANLANYAAGIINSLTDYHGSNDHQESYSLWRHDDGTGGVMVQMLSYTGNNAASRVIPLTPVSGRFPLLAVVVPHNAQAFYRDPSHAGSNSSNYNNSAVSTTAITAGAIDSITVGITLNAVGIVYDVFVIPGDTAGWNNGIFFPSSNVAPGGTGVWPLATYNPQTGDLNIIGDGGLVLNGQPPLTLLKDVSGIYTLVPDKTDDTLYDRQPAQTTHNVEIPDPTFKTGYLGG